MENAAAVWARVRPKPRLGAGAAAAGAWILWILLFPTNHWSKHISNVGLSIMPLVAAVQCAYHARGLTGRLRRGWLLLAGSSLSWGLGMVVWTTYESILGRDVPFPSLADVGYLATVPLAVAALLIFPTAPQRLAAQARTVVDGLVIGGSLLIISWILALGPVVHQGAGALADFLAIAYPLGDVIMATIVLFAIARSRLGSPLGRSTLLLLCGGLLAACVADSGFSYLALQNDYASGNRIDIGWFLGYLLIFLAARQAPRLSAAWMEPPLTRQSGNIVYTVVGLAVGTTGAALLVGTVDLFVAWVGLFLVAAIVARHVLIALDRNALEKSVEAWVPIRRGTAGVPPAEGGVSRRGTEDLESWVPLVGSGRRR
jgi:hypothetical protein